MMCKCHDESQQDLAMFAIYKIGEDKFTEMNKVETCMKVVEWVRKRCKAPNYNPCFITLTNARKRLNTWSHYSLRRVLKRLDKKFNL